MFKREHHEIVKNILNKLNADYFFESDACFAGGTAISLLNNEFRESIDIDILCFTKEGYRKIRQEVTNKSLGNLLKDGVESPVFIGKDIIADRYGIRTVLTESNVNIRFEIVFEGRLGEMPEVSKGIDSQFLFPTLGESGLFTQKLLVIADRGIDRSNLSRDIIDLIVLSNKLSDKQIQNAFKSAYLAYGENVIKKGVVDSYMMISKDSGYYHSCLKSLDIDPDFMKRQSEGLGFLKLKEYIDSFSERKECSFDNLRL